MSHAPDATPCEHSMMPTLRFALMLAAALLASCSKAPAPTPTTRPAQAPSIPELPNEGADVLRGRLPVGGMRVEYAAQLDAGQLTRIIEHRQNETATLAGEYEFKGARLLHYRGAKLGEPAELDLRFDLQGVLQAGGGPHVSEEDIRAIHGRAQLLRSLALAQRDTRMHR